MSGFEASKEDFESLVKKWDDALSGGIFKDVQKPATPSKGTSDHSFFGLRQDNPTSSIDDGDAKYWNAISSMADGGVEIERIDEDMVGASPNPNPVRKETEGPDSEINPRSSGLTFDEADIKKLEKMKIDLHELQSKAASMDEKNYETQISAARKKIDELSDLLCKPKQ
jgi:hypothetical protein